jgi:hypothetical protein
LIIKKFVLLFTFFCKNTHFLQIIIHSNLKKLTENPPSQHHFSKDREMSPSTTMRCSSMPVELSNCQKKAGGEASHVGFA